MVMTSDSRINFTAEQLRLEAQRRVDSAFSEGYFPTRMEVVHRMWESVNLGQFRCRLDVIDILKDLKQPNHACLEIVQELKSKLEAQGFKVGTSGSFMEISWK